MTFFTRLDLDTDRWTIMCRSHGYAEVAGERLFRSQPHPSVQFSHETEAGALNDLEVLRKYWEGLPQQKKKKAKGGDAWS